MSVRLIVQAVADAAHGVQQLDRKCVVHFFPQMLRAHKHPRCWSSLGNLGPKRVQ